MNTARYRLLLWPALAVNDKVVEVAPAMLLNVDPPSVHAVAFVSATRAYPV